MRKTIILIISINFIMIAGFFIALNMEFDQIISNNRYDGTQSELSNVKTFSSALYDEYLRFMREHPELSLEEVVSTVSFLNYVFIPTLIEAGYDEETIISWNESSQFRRYLQEGDVFSLNKLLMFAKRTGSDLPTLKKYMRYLESALRIEEIIEQVSFYQTVVVPNLTARGFSREAIDHIYQQFGSQHIIFLLETKLSAQQILELMATPHFNPEYLLVYEEILNKYPDRGITYAVQVVRHFNVKGNFYENVILTPYQDCLLTLVNGNYRLAHDFVPDPFQRAEVFLSEFALPGTNYLRADAAAATEALFASAINAGHHLILRKGFVSYETWQAMYNQRRFEMSQGIFAAEIPRPGHSEHQTGLAIAVTTPEMGDVLSAQFAQTEAGRWLALHAHQFGFIIRYLEDRVDETGVNFKPYHLRYVGIGVATEMFENNLILEDFILMHALLDQPILEAKDQVEAEEMELFEEVEADEALELVKNRMKSLILDII